MPTDLFSLFSQRNIILFIVVFTRLSGMMMTAPMLSTYPIPIQVRTWFMALVAFIMFPIVTAKCGFQVPNNMPCLTLILLKEFLIGYTVGFIANVVFVAAEIAANLVSMQMGITAAQAMNPMTGDTSTVLTQAYTLLASMVFIGINAYQWIFAALFRSFQVLQPGYSFFIDGQFTHNIVTLTSQMFSIGFSLALPLFSVLLITDILFGFVAKMMPKMNIFMVALPLKIYIGLLLFVLLLPHMYVYLEQLIENYLTSIIMILGG